MAICSVEGCGQPRRKREWCGSHYSQWRTKGEVKPFAYKWERLPACVVCGTPRSGVGRYCSDSCRVLDRNHHGSRPIEKQCVRCGDTFSLLTKGDRRGRVKLQRSDTAMCGPCYRARARPHKMSVSVLFQRDGDQCGICHTPIDMDLRFPDLMRPSVDHVLPYARGGTHDPENLQLAHLHCNLLKRDRILT